MTAKGSAEQGDAAVRTVRTSSALDAGALALLVALMALVSVVISVTRVSDFAGTSKAISLRESLTWDLSSTACWVALLPALIWLGRRFRLPDPRPWRPVALHLAATVPASILHVTLMGLVRWAIYASVDVRYNPWAPLTNGFYEYRKDVLTYGSLLVAIWTWQALRRPPAGDSPPTAGGEDAPLEVRDGGRRHFVRPQDIAWVEAAGNYVALHLDDREVLMRAPLASLEARLTSAGFARIHRSRLVNRARIASVEGTPAGDFTVTLRDGRTLTGSRRYRQAL